MRIPIREQLAGFLLITSLVPLAVLAIATWMNNHSFVTDITGNALELTASLKATQVASDLLLIQSTCATIVTRILLQDAIKSFYRGNLSADNWAQAERDVSGALRTGGYSSLLQYVYIVNPGGASGYYKKVFEFELTWRRIVIFSRNATGAATRGLLSVTGRWFSSIP